MEKTKIKNLGESSLGCASARVTRSRSRKRSQKLLVSSLVVDLDSKEETQGEMDAQMHDKLIAGTVDKGKEIQEPEDSVNTMVVVTTNHQSSPPREIYLWFPNS